MQVAIQRMVTLPHMSKITLWDRNLRIWVFLFGVAALAWARGGSRERLVAAMLNFGEVPKSRNGCDDQHGTKYASQRGENKTRVHNSACLKSSADYFSCPPVSEE